MPMMDRLDSNRRFLVSAASPTAASDLLQNAALQLLHIHLLTQLISFVIVPIILIVMSEAVDLRLFIAVNAK